MRLRNSSVHLVDMVPWLVYFSRRALEWWPTNDRWRSTEDVWVNR